MSNAGIQKLLIALNASLLGVFAASFAVHPFLLMRGARDESSDRIEFTTEAVPAAARPLRDYETAMRGKALFRYALQEEAAAAQRREIDDYRFLGTSRAPSGSRAFLQNTITNQTRTVSVGDAIGDYHVKEIRPGGVLLSKGEEQVELKR